MVMVRSWFDKLTTNGEIFSLLELGGRSICSDLGLERMLQATLNKKCGGHFSAPSTPEYLQF
jgi:hypothetical protein